jgi:hypothetical protein
MAVALSFYISPKRFYSGGLSGHTEPLLKLLQILDNVLWEFYTSPLHPIQGKWTQLPIAEPIFSALLHCKDTIPKIRKIFPEKKLRGFSPNSYIYVSVHERFIYFHDRSAYSAAGK